MFYLYNFCYVVIIFFYIYKRQKNPLSILFLETGGKLRKIQNYHMTDFACYFYLLSKPAFKCLKIQTDFQNSRGSELAFNLCVKEIKTSAGYHRSKDGTIALIMYLSPPEWIFQPKPFRLSQISPAEWIQG